jgi:16S rRNA (adenine1518-N6/adenine1519-N6)-dimethyltransferase
MIPRKKLGQHFLKNEVVIQEILRLAHFDESDTVIEIGPGLGALTVPLSHTTGRIIAVEKDSKLAEILKKRLDQKNIRNVELVRDDILRLDLRRLIDLSSGKMKIIGNLPYNISSPLLEKIIDHRKGIDRAVLMFQYEFARRLMAMPGTRAYGSLSVITQYYAHISPLLEVKSDQFYPKPKVGSMVLEIDFSQPFPNRTEDEVLFKKIVRQAFQHKRKTLLNSLSGAEHLMAKEEWRTTLLKNHIDPKRRAETLTIDEFISLTSAVAIGA